MNIALQIVLKDGDEERPMTTEVAVVNEDGLLKMQGMKALVMLASFSDLHGFVDGTGPCTITSPCIVLDAVTLQFPNSLFSELATWRACLLIEILMHVTCQRVVGSGPIAQSSDCDRAT